MHLFSLGILSVLSLELCTACIEKQRLEKETMKHNNGNFGLSIWFPRELIQVEALGRLFTITEAF